MIKSHTAYFKNVVAVDGTAGMGVMGIRVVRVHVVKMNILNKKFTFKQLFTYAKDIKLFGGEIEKAPGYEKLEEAKQLIKTHTPLYVWQKTGWIYNDKENTWRFETEDDEFELMDIETLVNNYHKGVYKYKLSDVLKNEKFYQLYPEAKNFKFVIVNQPVQEKIILAQSGFEEGGFKIVLTINLNKYEIIRRNHQGVARIRREVTRTTLHEVQHFLQRRLHGRTAFGIEEAQRKVRQDIRELRFRANRLKVGSERRILEEIADHLEKKFYRTWFDLYWNQPEEIEARNVSDRFFLTKEQRRQIPPYPLPGYEQIKNFIEE